MGDADSMLPGAAVADLWQLEFIDNGLFRGWCIDGAPMCAFGGQVAAQALAAAGSEVEGGRRAHSLHAYFVRPGDTSRPVLYRVDRTRDGQSISTRQVTAIQSGDAILILDASFHAPESGTSHGPTAPGVPSPYERELRDRDLLPPERATEAQWLVDQSAKFRFEFRFWDQPAALLARRGEMTDGQQFWFRSRDRLPDDPLQHACALTYASDLHLLSTALAVHGLSVRTSPIQASSLDHAIWFHRPSRLDEWLLYEQWSPTSASGRTLSTGRIFSAAGHLVATVMQEGLVRRQPRAVQHGVP